MQGIKRPVEHHIGNLTYSSNTVKKKNKDQRLEKFNSVQHFPVLAKLHFLESGKVTEEHRNYQRCSLSSNQNLQISPRKPSIPKSKNNISPKSKNSCINSSANTTVQHPKPFFPSSPSKAKKLTESTLISVNASSPYIPKHKVGVVSFVEKKKKFIHGDFKPSSRTNKKGCRVEDIFLNSADIYTKTMQMEFLKRKAKRNLGKIEKRQKEMLKSGILDVPTNASM